MGDRLRVSSSHFQAVAHVPSHTVQCAVFVSFHAKQSTTQAWECICRPLSIHGECGQPRLAAFSRLPAGATLLCSRPPASAAAARCDGPAAVGGHCQVLNTLDGVRADCHGVRVALQASGKAAKKHKWTQQQHTVRALQALGLAAAAHLCHAA